MLIKKPLPVLIIQYHMSKQQDYLFEFWFWLEKSTAIFKLKTIIIGEIIIGASDNLDKFTSPILLNILS